MINLALALANIGIKVYIPHLPKLAELELNDDTINLIVHYYLYINSLSSKNKNREDQLRRPEKTYGAKYEKDLNTDYFGPLKFRFKYQTKERSNIFIISYFNWYDF